MDRFGDALESRRVRRGQGPGHRQGAEGRPGPPPVGPGHAADDLGVLRGRLGGVRELGGGPAELRVLPGRPVRAPLPAVLLVGVGPRPHPVAVAAPTYDFNLNIPTFGFNLNVPTYSFNLNVPTYSFNLNVHTYDFNLNVPTYDFNLWYLPMTSISMYLPMASTVSCGI